VGSIAHELGHGPTAAASRIKDSSMMDPGKVPERRHYTFQARGRNYAW
jgi:hypothetical protein